MLTWMTTAQIGLVLLVLGVLLNVMSKVGEIGGQLSQLVHAAH